MGNRYADHVTPLYPHKLALTSPTGGGRSVGIVRSRTEATEFSFFFWCLSWTIKYFLSNTFLSDKHLAETYIRDTLTNALRSTSESSVTIFLFLSTFGTRKCSVQLPIVKFHKNTPTFQELLMREGQTDRQTRRQAERHRNVTSKSNFYHDPLRNPNKSTELFL